jgi:hypothetical protein
MRILFMLIAWLCLVLGTGGALAALYAFIDPAGAQMANDAEPFATPASRLRSAYIFMFCLTVAIFGGWNVSRFKQRFKRDRQDRI